MKHDGYRTRAMQARDPRFAQIFDALDRGRREPPASPAPQARAKPDPQPQAASKPRQTEATTSAAPAPDKDELAALRTEYESVIGKRPFMGWDADTLRGKIAAHQPAPTAADDQDHDTATDADEE